MLFLKPDRSFRPVPGIYGAVIRQYEKLFCNILDQLIKIASGKVCPADASVKQHIASDKKIIIFAVKTEMCRRMPRSEDQIQPAVPECNVSGFRK